MTDSITLSLRGQRFCFAANRTPSLFADSGLRLAYVGNPKAGCTTLKNALFYCDRGFSYVEQEDIHRSFYAFYQFNIGLQSTAEMFNRPNLFLFSVVSHPLARFVSGFTDKLLPCAQAEYFAMRDFLCARVGIDLSGDPVQAALAVLDFLERDEFPDIRPSFIDPHFRRQIDNLGVLQRLPLDFVGRLEEPSAIIAMFKDITGRDPAFLFQSPMRVSTHPAKAMLLESHAVRQAVERVYAQDYRAFGY